MRFAFPKPLKRWRVFAGEVGTIVLGVLLALGAQEFVQSLHWQREVRETRKALDAELSRNLAGFRHRMVQGQCIASRVAELERWLEGFRNGSPLALKGPITGPAGFAVRTAVWEVTDGEIASRMPLEAKLSYAGLYDSLRLYSDLRGQEMEAWSGLVEYEESSRLSEADWRSAKRLLADAEAINQALSGFPKTVDRYARELGIQPEANIDKGMHPVFAEWERDLCRPLL